MPRKKGTALGRVKRDMPIEKKLDIALYGSQTFNPFWGLADRLRFFAVVNRNEKNCVNLGDDATITGNAEHDKRFGCTFDKLRREVFYHVIGAVADKNAAFFERMAEAIRAGKDIWKDDKWEASDPLVFEILEARDALIESGKSVIRPKDIWNRLGNKHTFESVRDRISRYAIPGIFTGKGRPKSRKNAKQYATLKSLRENYTVLKNPADIS